MPNGSHTDEQSPRINKVDSRRSKCMEAKNGEFVELNSVVKWESLKIQIVIYEREGAKQRV